MTTNAIDVTEATFEQEVVERSYQTPVVIDFWAAWCAPCRSLGPVLERAVAARGGAVVLAKVDVDANQMLAQSFGVQGIPAVKAVADGRLVAEFVGAQPPAYVERFLDALAPRPSAPEEAEPLTPEEAAERWRARLDEDPDDAEARVGLAGQRLAAGRLEEAETLLRPVEHLDEAAELRGRLRLLREAADAASPYAEAARQAVDGAPGEALARLLGAVRASGGAERDRARELMLDVFRVLGDGDPLTQRYRRHLTMALY
ncbi:MAG TPA: tetratricopeptide repeat protein [Actinomycetes bacterium]|nr:tetratricopeptide repeat protein [Actinomycetes bacterium]